MLFIRAGIHKMLVRIANREAPDYTDLDLALFGKQVVFENLELLLYMFNLLGG